MRHTAVPSGGSQCSTVKIATLIAVYKADDSAAFRAAMQSVLDQQLADHTVSRIYLGVDGPLPEPLAAEVEAFTPRLHRVVRNEYNLGLAATLNRLIGELEDETFVFRMDADDIAKPMRYQRQLDWLTEHSDVHLCGTDMIEFDTATGERRRVSYALDDADARARLPQRVPMAHPTVCFRRAVLDTVGGYPLTGTNEDVSMWFECARRGFRFGNLHEPLLDFRINSQFWQRRSVKKAFSEYDCYRKGIRSLWGPMNWRQIYPLARLALRLAPRRLSRWAYRLKMRG